MFNDESLESQSQQEAESISSDAADWGSEFVKRLELEYADSASELPIDATWPDFQQAMMIAVGKVFDESGATPESIARLWEKIADRLLPIDVDVVWSRKKNARRLKLIDKKIQQTITPKEAIELMRLTGQMRVRIQVSRRASSQRMFILELATTEQVKIQDSSIPPSPSHANPFLRLTTGASKPANFCRFGVDARHPFSLPSCEFS